jgi:hypothetical protein
MGDHFVDEEGNVSLSGVGGHSGEHVTVHTLETAGKGANGRVLDFVNVTDETMRTFSVGELPFFETVGTTLGVVIGGRIEVNSVLRVILLADGFAITEELDTTTHH